MRKKLAGWFLLCFLVCAMVPVSVQAAWTTTAQGRMYTTSAAPGYYTGWHKIGKYTYYFNSKGIMQTGWGKISKKYYYFGTNGRMRTGWLTLKDKKYYLGTNGVRRTGWVTIKSGTKTLKYYFDSQGVMQTGLQTIKNKMYYFNSSGVRQYGFIRDTATGKVYYANKTTGVLVQEAWVGNYYFQEDGTMAVNQWIEGRWVGSDGRFTGIINNVGWVTNNGIRRYYDRNSRIVYGWLTLSGKKYYLDTTTGALQYGWFKVGNYTYYSDSKGVVQTNTWVGKKYLKSTGAMATGWLTVDGKRYYFDPSTGDKLVNCWKKIGKCTYHFDENGVKQVNTWIDGKYYVGEKGARAKGVTKIDGKYYYFSVKSNGILLKGWIKYGNDMYYAHSTKGYLYVNKWFTKSSNKYYAGADCKLYKGLKTISGKLYYFNTTNGRMVKNTKMEISGSTYYFEADGAAAKSKWVKINSKYYYFESNGKMAVNRWVGSYYVGADGARTNQTLTVGLNTIGGKIYCYDSNGNMLKGWQTVNGNKYYFGSDGAAVKGLQVISGKKYYFYPTCILAVNLTLAVGDKEYTINASGVVIAERTINVSGTTTGSKIAKFAIKYVGNPYVYGGTSLTNGADCSGFVQTVFAQFGIKLLRVADDQMKGPSTSLISAGYKRAVVVSTNNMLPGDLVFYGSSNYASHVAIYIGDGKIVHASNSQPYPLGGIKISQYNYQTPIRIVRYWS